MSLKDFSPKRQKLTDKAVRSDTVSFEQGQPSTSLDTSTNLLETCQVPILKDTRQATSAAVFLNIHLFPIY